VDQYPLSGDNAVVIAMACRGLPNRQRLWGMILGAAWRWCAHHLSPWFVAALMDAAVSQAHRGLRCLHLGQAPVPEDPDETKVEAVEHLWRAVRTIAVADIIMSLDNGCDRAAAQGNTALLSSAWHQHSLIVAGAA